LAVGFREATPAPYGGTLGDAAPALRHATAPFCRRCRDRLRYIQMFAPKIVGRIEKSAPAGSDVKSWKY
jgi:hypothetical protein